MHACSFDRLWQFVNERLDLDGQLELYYHLDECAICRDTVYQLFYERENHASSGTASPRHRISGRDRITARAPAYSSSPVMFKDMGAHWSFPGLTRDARRRR